MNISVISLGSAGFRTVLKAAPDFPRHTKVLGIDTCMEETFRDARREGYTVSDQGVIVMEKEQTSVNLHIAGRGEGGGMDWQQGRKILNSEFKEGSSLMQKLEILKDSHVCVCVAFAGNATGTNIPLLLSKIVPMFPKTVFIPVIGIPLRSQTTELEIAMNVTLKEMHKRANLPGYVLVDNQNITTFADLQRIDKELPAAIRGLVEVMSNSAFFSFDIGDLRRTLTDPDFAILGHTRLKDSTNDLMDRVLSLVNIEKQNKGQYGVIALKMHSSEKDQQSRTVYDQVSKWAGKWLLHCKTTPQFCDGGAFDPEVTVLMGGYSLKAIRPMLPEVDWL